MGRRAAGIVGAIVSASVACNSTPSQTPDGGAPAVVPSAHALTVLLNGSGTVTSSPAGINCGATCTASFGNGAQVQLSAAPAPGWSFAGFSGACTGNSCSVTMSADVSVSATFTQNPPPPPPPPPPGSHTLTVAVQGQGTVTSSPGGISCAPGCTANFPDGTQVSLSAAPASGWSFSAFSGACTGATCSVTISADVTVIATFTQNPPPPPVTHMLTVKVNGQGTVTSAPSGISCAPACSATFNDGTQLQLSAAAASGWSFAGFSGACTGATCAFTLSADAAVTATFTENPPPPPSDCAGLGPGPLPAAIVYQTIYSSASQADYCGLPIGDGNGFVAMKTFPTMGHPTFTILSPAGAVTGSFGFWHGDAFPAPAGFVGFGGSSTQQMVVVDGFDESGHVIGNTLVNGSAVFAADPNGGMLAVGLFNPGGAPTPPPPHPFVQMFNANGTTRWGPVLLGSDATVFGAGVDLLGRAVIILDGSGSFGPGSIAARWFASNGAAVTGVFQIISGFAAGPSTWFETSPLFGGGLAMRRMDAPAGGGETRTSQWLLLLPSGSASTQPAPAWLTSRPNTNMQVARSGHAYAFSPWATDAGTCDQHVEIVSPAGNSCGVEDFPVDGSACTTRELRVGLDGTVMQMLPASREKNQPPGSPLFTCTLHYWPAALR